VSGIFAGEGTGDEYSARKIQMLRFLKRLRAK
jgi:hypothetical protein